MTTLPFLPAEVWRPPPSSFDEVLALVTEGLRNADIAQRLFVSPKTGDHHVAAILAKLGVRSRAEAAMAAARLGIDG
jgi:DNA-binding NarL/FixJ family response regulator